MPSRWLIPSEKVPASWPATSVSPDRVQHLVDPASGNAVGGRHGEQVVAGAAPRVDRSGVEQATDLAHRVAVFGIPLAVDQGSSGGRPVEPEDETHGGGLAGAVRPEEAGDPARRDLDGEAVDSGLVAVPLGQAGERDHGANLRAEPGRTP